MYESDASESHSGAVGSAVNDTEAGWSPTLEAHDSQDTEVALTCINPYSASPPDGCPSAPHFNCTSEPAYVSKSTIENTPEVIINNDPRSCEEHESGFYEIPNYTHPENAVTTYDSVEIAFVTPRNYVMNLSECNTDATLSVDHLPKPVVIINDLLEVGHQQTAASVQSDQLTFVERSPASESGDAINNGPPTENKVPVEKQDYDQQKVRSINGSVQLNRWRSIRNSLGANSLSVQSSIINDTESYILTLSRKASSWVSNKTYNNESYQQEQHNRQQRQQQQQQDGTSSNPPAKETNPHKKRCFRLGKTVLWALLAILLVALSPLIMIGYGIYAMISCLACPKERQNDTVT